MFKNRSYLLLALGFVITGVNITHLSGAAAATRTQRTITPARETELLNKYSLNRDTESSLGRSEERAALKAKLDDMVLGDAHKDTWAFVLNPDNRPYPLGAQGDGADYTIPGLEKQFKKTAMTLGDRFAPGLATEIHAEYATGEAYMGAMIGKRDALKAKFADLPVFAKSTRRNFVGLFRDGSGKKWVVKLLARNWANEQQLLSRVETHDLMRGAIESGAIYKNTPEKHTRFRVPLIYLQKMYVYDVSELTGSDNSRFDDRSYIVVEEDIPYQEHQAVQMEYLAMTHPHLTKQLALVTRAAGLWDHQWWKMRLIKKEGELDRLVVFDLEAPGLGLGGLSADVFYNDTDGKRLSASGENGAGWQLPEMFNGNARFGANFEEDTNRYADPAIKDIVRVRQGFRDFRDAETRARAASGDSEAGAAAAVAPDTDTGTGAGSGSSSVTTSIPAGGVHLRPSTAPVTGGASKE